MKRLLLASAAALALIGPASAQPPSGLWDHNGSAMQLRYANGAGFGLYYDAIRSGLRQTTPQGAPRFEGRDVGGGRIVGTAYVYTKFCFGKPFPYHVEGSAYNGTIELYGPAAVVDPNSCSIVGYRPDSDNARIVFHLVQPDAPEPVVVPIPQPPIIVPIPQQPIVIPPPMSSGGTSGHTTICPVIGDCLTTQAKPKSRTNGDAEVPRREPSPDEQFNDVKRRAEELCWKWPGRSECQQPNREDRRPSPAMPLDK